METLCHICVNCIVCVCVCVCVLWYVGEVGSGEEVSRQQLEEVRRRLSLSEKEVKKQGEH